MAAAEYSAIPPSDFSAELERLLTPDPAPDGNPVHSEIHECLRILRALAPLVELVDELPTLRPLLAAYKRTSGGTVGMLGMRKALRNGR